MGAIVDNDLKTKGIKAIEEALLDQLVTPVSVQGRVRYVVMTQEQYQYLRECELKVAISESKADLAIAHFAKETVAQHMKHLQKMNHFPK